MIHVLGTATLDEALAMVPGEDRELEDQGGEGDHPEDTYRPGS